MLKSSRKTILISVPSSCNDKLKFPYVYAVLKSYCDHIDSLNNVFEWLEPIYHNTDISFILGPYKDKKIDVLGLSCYIWNFDLQCRVADQIKKNNPECLVVAGGPHLDHKAHDFFLKHPYIDIIIVQDGEVPFSKILTKFTHGEKDFTDIPGLILPATDRKGVTHTGPTELPTVFEHSPYIENSQYFEKLIQRHGIGGIDASWETNRGCPYGCSYCDWGSNTRAKVRPFDIERIKAEADWFGKLKIPFVGLNDANFGILSRDTEIIDFIISAHKEYGYPKTLFYCITKNNPERNIEIAMKIYESGIWSLYQLPFQHTRKNVQKSIDRANISIEQQRETIVVLKDTDIPIMIELIVGLPGDTYDQWKACLADVMEWGLHDNYAVFPFILLPNAPAAEKSYKEKYQIETIELCDVVYNIGKIEKTDPIDRLSRAKFVVKTETFSREDWVNMKTYSSFVQALHNCSVTQLITQYLRFTHNVTYKEFYENLIEHFADSDSLGNDLYNTILNLNKDLLINEYAVVYLDIKQLPTFRHRIEGFRWIFVKICLNIRRFFDELKTFLLEKYPFATNLESAINYQESLIILPYYDREIGKVFSTDFDWVQYFREAKRLTAYKPLPEPAHTAGSSVEVTDKYCGNDLTKCQLDWDSDNWEGSWIRWIDRVVIGFSSASRTNFQQLSFRMKEDNIGIDSKSKSNIADNK